MTRCRLLLLAAAVFAARSAPAVGLPSCSLFSGYTLTDMLGQSCVVGDKVFSNFSSTSDPSVTDMVKLTPLAPVNNDPGIEFDGLAASAGQVLSFNIVYTVQVLPKYSFAIETGELSIPAITFGGTGAAISGMQNYCENTKSDAESCTAGGGSLYSTSIGAMAPSTSVLSATSVPLSLILDVSTDLTLNGGASGTSVSWIDERFQQIATPGSGVMAAPEPGAFFLLGSGLLVASGLAFSSEAPDAPVRFGN